MNKYLYAILRLKTTSWIKYWLYNKSMKIKGVLSNILEGISFYLTDSLNRKFNLFQIIGRSVQDGTPTPKNPIEIKNTGDNGSINEKVQKVFSFVQGGIGDVTGVDNIVTTRIKTDFIEVTENTSIIYNCYSDESVKLRGVHYYNKDKTWLSYSGQSEGYDFPNTKITPVNCKYIRAVVQKSTNSENITPNNKYLRLSISPEQNISIPLAQGQKLMQGDYLADDGVHHVRGEVDLSTLELTILSGIIYRSPIIPNIKIPATVNNLPNVLAEKYKQRVQAGDFNNGEIAIASNRRFFISDNTGTPTGLVQYPLAQEVIDPYTPEQQQAWNNIKKLRTYKPVTHISSEDELPANLKIQYWKEG